MQKMTVIERFKDKEGEVITDRVTVYQSEKTTLIEIFKEFIKSPVEDNIIYVDDSVKEELKDGEIINAILHV